MNNTTENTKAAASQKMNKRLWGDAMKWLKLMVISLSRIRKRWASISFAKDKISCENEQNKMTFSLYHNKQTIMKLQTRLIKCSALLLLFLFSKMIAIAQGPYPNTGNMSVCVNAVEPYGVVLNPGSSYQWTITPLAGGNATFVVGATPNLITATWTTLGTATMQVVETNAQGCVGDPVTIIVTVNPKPALVITNPVAVCTPATVDITAASVTGASSAGLTLTYWKDAAATIAYATPTAATAGTYYIKGVSSGGCSDIKPVVVTVNPLPALVITNPAAVCAPATVDITAASVTGASSAGLTLTYWKDAAATIAYATPTAATAGTYYIKGVSSGGCSDIKPVVVTVNPLPALVITNPAAVCAPATVDITAAAVTGASSAGLTLTYWKDAAATITYATPTVATAGTYYIKGVSSGGCSDIKPVVVTVNPLPALVITNPAAVCAPATVDITAAAVTGSSSAGLTLSYWKDAAATIAYATPTAATAGTYYIKGVNSGGCSDIKPVVVTVNPAPSPAITGPSPVCESAGGTTATYNTPNVPGHSYAWTIVGGSVATGQGTNQVNVTWTTPGAGSVTVLETITIGGCSANVVKPVTINPKPVTTPISHN